jgi:hypothetical protein
MFPLRVRVGVAEQIAKRPDQGRAGGPQLVAMVHRQLTQHSFAGTGKPDVHLATVGTAARTFHQASLFQAVHQADHAVMAQQKAARQVPDGRLAVRAERHNGQQTLVLGGLKAERACRLLAEVEEAAELIAEFGESAVFPGGDPAPWVHDLYRIAI